MGGTDVGQDTDGGFNNAGERRHFAGLGDASLDDGKVMRGIYLPKGEWYTNLGIVAFGAGSHMTVGRKQLDEPIFDNGFSIAPRDAYHRNIELLTVVGGNLLESLDNIIDLPQVDVGIIYLIRVWYNE